MDTYEVLKFVKIHFEKFWKFQLIAPTVMQYTATDKESKLRVVTQGDAGLWSYDYVLVDKEIVFVIGDLVYIPGKYSSRTTGDTF